MKSTSSSILHNFRAAALAAVVLAASSTLQAQSWDGGGASNSWGQADNWDPNGVPAFTTTTDLVFDNLTRPNNFIGNNRIVRSISYGANIDSLFQSNVQDFAGGASRNLTLQADAGNASITVDAGAAGDITLGNAGGTGSFGNIVLASNLNVVHNGTGTLLLNRPIQGATFGLTKTGSGTLELRANNSFTGALNINGGTVVANAFSATGGDLNAASGINLGGGALTIRSNFNNKTYDLVPVTVSSASTLAFENVDAFNYSLSFTGAGAFALNANLSLQNNSTVTANVNPLNIARNITGTGEMTVQTYNNITSSADAYSLGRILLSGNNSGWSGDLVVAQGTVSLGPSNTTALVSGTGRIVIGTTADSFGAGVTFFPTTANGTTVTFANDITVRSGGFRSIKGSGTDHSIVLNGAVTLEGNLNLDSTFFGGAFDRSITMGGNISGAGGLDITQVGGNNNTFIRLNGTNTYAGNTTVTSGGLIIDGSVTSPSVTVASGARFGGNGSLGGTLALANGAKFVFSLASTLDVVGSVTLDSSFGIASLVNVDGSVIDWSTVGNGVYTLIGTTASDFSGITNFGLANAADVGGGKSAYFENGSLQLMVVPEPSTWALLAAGLIALLVATGRRSQKQD